MVENPSVRSRIRGWRTERRPLLQELSREIPADAANLLMALLQFNPAKRLSAKVGVWLGSEDKEALHHRFFVDLVSTLQPVDCVQEYDGGWEERWGWRSGVRGSLRRNCCNRAMLKEFIQEQQHYPVVKCKYSKL